MVGASVSARVYVVFESGFAKLSCLPQVMGRILTSLLHVAVACFHIGAVCFAQADTMRHWRTVLAKTM